jgi:hypothetical protein
MSMGVLMGEVRPCSGASYCAGKAQPRVERPLMRMPESRRPGTGLLGFRGGRIDARKATGVLLSKDRCVSSAIRENALTTVRAQSYAFTARRLDPG